MDLRRRNGAVIRHDMLFRMAFMLFCTSINFLLVSSITLSS